MIRQLLNESNMSHAQIIQHFGEYHPDLHLYIQYIGFYLLSLSVYFHWFKIRLRVPLPVSVVVIFLPFNPSVVDGINSLLTE